MKIEYTDSFTSDLNDAFRWIAERAPATAQKFITEVEDICERRIALRPGLGSFRPWLGQDIRAHHSATFNRTIYYRVAPDLDTIFFIRLIYRQDIKPKDFSE